MKRLFLLLVFIALAPQPAGASDISVHGFVQGNYSVGTAMDNPDGGSFKLAEERLQLKLDASSGPFHVLVKGDAFYGHVENSARLELREGYIDYTAEKWDFRAGRQIITWGLGDLLFINDVFPKDYEAFFSGRPLEYLKKGVDGMKLGVYPDFASFDIVVVPFFEPNRFPDPKRYSVFNPMPGIPQDEKEPATNLENTEVALRAYRDIAGFDAAVYFYRGFSRQPSVMPDNLMAPTKLTLFFPMLSVYGASLQGRALDGVISLETGYYGSRQDGSGTNPMMPNSQLKYLVGYQRQLWEDFSIGMQYYGEYMLDYAEYRDTLPAGFPRESELHQLASVRLTQFLSHQTLRLSLFAFYSPSEDDYMLNPEVKYNFSDHVWAALGANVFGGRKRTSQFGQLESDDNIYAQLRYEF
ncbi:MAG: hypothetical protein HZA22_04830 [Nitrospirae bacterium]|nr:hypothetical protein [Nitrospirota bacterium]